MVSIYKTQELYLKSPNLGLTNFHIPDFMGNQFSTPFQTVLPKVQKLINMIFKRELKLIALLHLCISS